MDPKKFIDCSHLVCEEFPPWPGSPNLVRCPGTTVAKDGYFTENYQMSKIGTHIDSPGHFTENGRLIHQLTLEELFSPGVVIDVVSKCALNPDYELSVQDILEYENTFGPIPSGALVCMKTGFGEKVNDGKSYMGLDETCQHPFYPGGMMHFPGFSKESAEFLVNQRDIHGIGIDTLSLDPGISTTFDVHRIVLGKDKYQIENMKLDEAPQAGFSFLALPLKVKNAPEMMCRVLAIPH